MTADWQTIAVALIIFAAALYVGRRGWSRLRSFRVGKAAGAPSCATGCGACGESQPVNKPADVLVQIKPSRR